MSARLPCPTSWRRCRGGGAKTPPQSRGFEIVGIRTKQLKAAEQRAADRRAKWEARGPKSKAKEPPPWNEAEWLDKQKVRRAMRETFAVKSAAETAAAMLVKQGGWVRVSVQAGQ